MAWPDFFEQISISDQISLYKHIRQNTFLILYAQISQNGQTQSNNSSANCLSVFDRFVGLVLKGLNSYLAN